MMLDPGVSSGRRVRIDELSPGFRVRVGVRTSRVERPASHYDLDVAFPTRLSHDLSVSNSLVSSFGRGWRSALIVYVDVYVGKECG